MATVNRFSLMVLLT